MAKEWNWRGDIGFGQRNLLKWRIYLFCTLSETSTFFKQYLDMSRKHISVRVNLAASFTFEQFMAGNYHDHETSAHTVNCMRLTTTATRTTKRTVTTTVLYYGH